MVGTVESVASFQRPWVRTDAVLGDPTGAVVLRFMGREGVPGIVPGRRLRATGTPACTCGRLVILNPLYEFESRA